MVIVKITQAQLAGSSSVQTLAHDLDFSNLTDEELVVLAVECGYAPATELLLQRVHVTSTRIVMGRARRLHLSNEDTDDAVQNAVFAVLRAINRYDTRRMIPPAACKFRTFMERVVRDDFKDFVSALWRRKVHFPQFCEGDRHAGDCAAENAWASADPAAGPCRVAQQNELVMILRETIKQLSQCERSLYESRLAGDSLTSIAATLNISSFAAKRLWQKLLTKLRKSLQQRD